MSTTSSAAARATPRPCRIKVMLFAGARGVPGVIVELGPTTCRLESPRAAELPDEVLIQFVGRDTQMPARILERGQTVHRLGFIYGQTRQRPLTASDDSRDAFTIE